MWMLNNIYIASIIKLQSSFFLFDKYTDNVAHVNIDISSEPMHLTTFVPWILLGKYSGDSIDYQDFKLPELQLKFKVTHGGLDTCHSHRLFRMRQWWMDDRILTH